MKLKGLLEFTDAEIRKELSEYYVIPKSRIEGIILAFENGTDHIKRLHEVIARQQEDIARLSKKLLEVKNGRTGTDSKI